jgi:hypothetical protein
MQTHEEPNFFQILNTMSEYFSDPMTPLRQRVYWDCCVEYRVTIEEWADACTWAMKTTTFNKVPLFGLLMGHITNERDERSKEAHEREKAAQITARSTVPDDGERGLTAAEAKEVISKIVAMLEAKMTTQPMIRRLADHYRESTTKTPGLYTGMSEEEYQHRRAVMLTQMDGLPKEQLREERPMMSYEDAKRLLTEYT